MSLMRLLSVGCSLGRVTDQPNRYRILRRGLPKFGPDKPGTVEKNRKKTNTMQNADAKSWSAPIAGAMAAEEAKPVQPFPLGRWNFFRNPFGNMSPKPSRPVEPIAPVQGELSLDAVRPVRNDLTDSDVMVIRGPKGASEAASVQPSAGSEALGPEREPVWSRLKNQFFGADKA
jgi:hypothetical protein